MKRFAPFPSPPTHKKTSKHPTRPPSCVFFVCLEYRAISFSRDLRPSGKSLAAADTLRRRPRLHVLEVDPLRLLPHPPAVLLSERPLERALSLVGHLSCETQAERQRDRLYSYRCADPIRL